MKSVNDNIDKASFREIEQESKSGWLALELSERGFSGVALDESLSFAPRPKQARLVAAATKVSIPRMLDTLSLGYLRSAAYFRSAHHCLYEF